MGNTDMDSGPPPIRILVINPNTSVSMTDALKPMIDALGYDTAQYAYFTCPSPGIPSINSPDDAAKSADLCLQHLTPLLAHHDAFLVACYSQHPLIPLLKSECAKLAAAAATSGGHGARKYVTGIFEASVTTSLSLICNDGAFGIVSTGKVWEEALGTAVLDFLGAGDSDRFVGCETTGLNASELHDLPANEVREKMMAATSRLVKPKGKKVDVNAVCLGCAGMVGLDEAVREACVRELGQEKGSQVKIVDGVKAGVGLLYSLARGGF